MTVEFYRTVMGARFFEHTVPALLNAVERVARALEQQLPAVNTLVRQNEQALSKREASSFSASSFSDGVASAVAAARIIKMQFPHMSCMERSVMLRSLTGEYCKDCGCPFVANPMENACRCKHDRTTDT